MPYDPYKKLFTPDFQNNELPQWQNMGDDQQQAPDINPFVAALKKRMGGGMMKGAGDMNSMGKAMGSASSGGGMQSL